MKTPREKTKRTSKEATDLEKLRIPNWEEKVQNREEWKVFMATKTLEEL